jgi:hypothetical protein
VRTDGTLAAAKSVIAEIDANPCSDQIAIGPGGDNSPAAAIGHASFADRA